MPVRLGGEERLEDAPPDRLVHADAGVAHGQHRVRPGPRAGMLGGVDRVEVDGARLDGERAAVGHRVAGVDDQVQHHLFDLAGVGLDAGQVGRQLQHAASTSSPTRRCSMSRRPVTTALRSTISGLRICRRLTASSRPVSAAARSPACRIWVEVAPGRIVLGQPAEHQIGHAVDDRQQVVEVVRDAAGEPADDLHLLRLLQLLLELALLGDVGGGADHADAPRRLVVDVEGAIADPAHGAVGPDDAVDLVVVAAAQARIGGLLDALAIVRDAPRPSTGSATAARLSHGRPKIVSKAGLT